MYNRENEEQDEMQPEYDFAGGIRGKHYLAFQRGYTVHVRKADGTTTEETYTPPPRTIVLDPDVFAYFSDAESVNRTLRTLIEIVPQKRGA